MLVLYSESQLQLRADAPQAGLPALVSELRAAGSAAGRERLVRDALSASGFEWLAYGTLAQWGRARVPASFLTTYAHRGWTQRYFASRCLPAHGRD